MRRCAAPAALLVMSAAAGDALVAPAPGWRSETMLVEASGIDPIAVARGVDGAIWILDREGVRVLREGEAPRTFIEGLIGPVAIVPLDTDRALLLEPPHLHLVIDENGDGRADRTRVVAGGLEGATALHLASDGTLALLGSPRRLRWLGDRAECAPAALLTGRALAEDCEGNLLIASEGVVMRCEHAWPGSSASGRAVPAPIAPFAAHGRTIQAIAPHPLGVIVAGVDGWIGRPQELGARWGWSAGESSSALIAQLAPGRAIALAEDVEGGLLVALGASEGEDDGAILALTLQSAATRVFPRLDAPSSDLFAQLADADRVRRRLLREALLVRLRRGEVAKAEVLPAARAILRSHRDPALRREALHLIDRVEGVTEGDLAAAIRDPDPALRRDAVRLAGRRGCAACVAAGRADVDPLVRVEALLAQLALHAGSPNAPLLFEVCGALAAERGDGASAVLAALAAGRETALLNALLEHDESTEFLAHLLDEHLRSASPAERRRLLERALRGACSPGQREVILGRFGAAVGVHERRPRRMQLDGAPEGLSAAAAAHPFVARIEPHLRWPGRTDVVDEAVSIEEILDEGRRLYFHCVACHGPAGLGQPGIYPPLRASALATGEPERFAKILLHGLEGGRTAEGRLYAGQMLRAPLVEDEELAALMTYVRRSFGNDAEAVSPAVVRAAREASGDRKRPWTIPELER